MGAEVIKCESPGVLSPSIHTPQHLFHLHPLLSPLLLPALTSLGVDSFDLTLFSLLPKQAHLSPDMLLGTGVQPQLHNL